MTEYYIGIEIINCNFERQQAQYHGPHASWAEPIPSYIFSLYAYTGLVGVSRVEIIRSGPFASTASIPAQRILISTESDSKQLVTSQKSDPKSSYNVVSSQHFVYFHCSAWLIFPPLMISWRSRMFSPWSLVWVALPH